MVAAPLTLDFGALSENRGWKRLGELRYVFDADPRSHANTELHTKLVATLSAHGLEPRWAADRLTVSVSPWQRRRHIDEQVKTLAIDRFRPTPVALVQYLPALTTLSLEVKVGDPRALCSPSLKTLTLVFDSEGAARASRASGTAHLKQSCPSLRTVRFKARS